ncbi:MAG: hypothetical protein N2491_01770 [Negativicutes bacterium]|nr:hypothetical protein [Negativicutes bacterium]
MVEWYWLPITAWISAGLAFMIFAVCAIAKMHETHDCSHGGIDSDQGPDCRH